MSARSGKASGCSSATRWHHDRPDVPRYVAQGAQGRAHGPEAASSLAETPYALRHAAISTWLSAGVLPAQVAAWAGHSVTALLHAYAKCIAGQEEEAKRRITDATQLMSLAANQLTDCGS